MKIEIPFGILFLCCGGITGIVWSNLVTGYWVMQMTFALAGVLIYAIIGFLAYIIAIRSTFLCMLILIVEGVGIIAASWLDYSLYFKV